MATERFFVIERLTQAFLLEAASREEAEAACRAYSEAGTPAEVIAVTDDPAVGAAWAAHVGAVRSHEAARREALARGLEEALARHPVPAGWRVQLAPGGLELEVLEERIVSTPACDVAYAHGEDFEPPAARTWVVVRDRSAWPEAVRAVVDHAWAAVPATPRVPPPPEQLYAGRVARTGAASGVDWTTVARGYWVLADEAREQCRWREMRRLAAAAEDAARRTDPVVAALFGRAAPSEADRAAAARGADREASATARRRVLAEMARHRERMRARRAAARRKARAEAAETRRRRLAGLTVGAEVVVRRCFKHLGVVVEVEGWGLHARIDAALGRGERVRARVVALSGGRLYGKRYEVVVEHLGPA